MGRTVRELLGALDSRELTEWMAFDQVEPIGGRRGDVQAAVVASTIANVYRRKGGRVLTPADFMPEYGAPAQAASLDDWLGMRLSEQAYGREMQDADWQAAPAGENPDADNDPEQLQRGDRELAADGDGVGGADAAAGGDA